MTETQAVKMLDLLEGIHSLLVEMRNDQRMYADEKRNQSMYPRMVEVVSRGLGA